ncbi:MAG: amidophosphoribosyltransferase [Nanoarchaeota archaeon]
MYLKKRFEQRWAYVTECDVEHIQFCLAEHLMEKKFYKAESIDEFVEEKLFPSIDAVIQEVKGAYSVVGIIGKKGMFAFKDQHGIRPLCYGKKETSSGIIHAFASESSVFSLLNGYENIRELERGEAVFVSFEGKSYQRILRQERQAFCSFEPVYFSYPNSMLLSQYVHDIREQLGKTLAEQYAEFRERIDHVTDAPKTAIPAAVSLAWAWGKPYGGLFARGDMRSFLEPDQFSRDEEIRRKLVFIPSAFKGKRVAVIDDSIVRGSTSRRMVSLFRECGAREVHIFSTFPQIISPCIYGIDTPDEDELIAARYGGNSEKIAAEIGADSVNFLSIDNLVKALGVKKEELCLACLNKDYPSGKEYMHEYISSRVEERTRLKI